MARLQVADPAPDQRPGDAPAVEREGGQQVEDEDRRVDEELVVDDGPQRVRGVDAGSATRDDAEGSGDRQRHRRAGEGEAQLVARGLRVALHPGDAAQQPEVDLLDLDPVAARDDAWPSSCRRMLAKSSRALSSPSA